MPPCRPCPRISNIFIPTMPISLKASLTSLILSSRIMASIFFSMAASPGYKINGLISSLSMRADIQADLFFHGRNPQPYAPVEQFGQNIGNPETKNYGDRHGEKLNADLIGIAEKQAVGPVTVDGCRGKHTGSHHAPHAGHTVAGPHIQGLVQLTSFPKAHGVIRKRRSYCSDHHGCQRRYIA